MCFNLPLISILSAILIVVNSDQPYFTSNKWFESWTDAKQYCKRKNAQLATFHSMDDISAMIDICSNATRNTRSNWCWTGWSDLNSAKCVYEFVDGELMNDLSAWGAYAPGSCATHTCGCVWNRGKDVIYVAGCGLPISIAPFYAICEHLPTTEAPTTEAPTEAPTTKTPTAITAQPTARPTDRPTLPPVCTASLEWTSCTIASSYQICGSNGLENKQLCGCYKAGSWPRYTTECKYRYQCGRPYFCYNQYSYADGQIGNIDFNNNQSNDKIGFIGKRYLLYFLFIVGLIGFCCCIYIMKLSGLILKETKYKVYDKVRTIENEKHKNVNIVYDS